MCGQFERAVAALWEHQETEVEAVHLAIALAYHGLLRVPARAETSDLTPCTYVLGPGRSFLIVSASVASTIRSARSWSFRYHLEVYQAVRQDGRKGGVAVCLLCLLVRRPTRSRGQGASRERVGARPQDHRAGERWCGLGGAGWWLPTRWHALRKNHIQLDSRAQTTDHPVRVASSNNPFPCSDSAISTSTTNTFSSAPRRMRKKMTGRPRRSSCTTLLETTRPSLRALRRRWATASHSLVGMRRHVQSSALPPTSCGTMSARTERWARTAMLRSNSSACVKLWTRRRPAEPSWHSR